MRKLRSQNRKINLLFALELLDEAVRTKSMPTPYVGSLTEQAVTAAIAKARRRSSPKTITVRKDQTSMMEIMPGEPLVLSPHSR